MLTIDDRPLTIDDRPLTIDDRPLTIDCRLLAIDNLDGPADWCSPSTLRIMARSGAACLGAKAVAPAYRRPAGLG